MDVKTPASGRPLAAKLVSIGLLAATLPLFAATTSAGAVPARSAAGPRAAATPVGAGSCIDTGARRSHGASAVARLGSDLDRAASRAGMSEASLRHELLTDSTLWVDGCGQPFPAILGQQHPELPGQLFADKAL